MQGARISHDVTIGNNCIIGNGSQVSGCCVVEDYAILTSNVLMQGKTRLGTYAAVQGGCRFTKDIPPYCVAAHEPTAFTASIPPCCNMKVFRKRLLNI